MNKTLFKYTTYVLDTEGNEIDTSYALMSVAPGHVLEGWFDKSENQLTLLINSAKEYKQFLPIPTKHGFKRDSKNNLIERLEAVQRYYEINIKKPEEIEAFLNTFCINP